MAIVGALPFTLQNGTTADATQVMADFNSIKNDVNTNAAKNGANNDITSLAGLTTPLSVAQGGTGSTTAAGGAANLPVSLGFGYLFGLTLSNDTGDATNDLDIAAGYAAENTAGIVMQLASAYVKRLDAAWAVGTNQGMRDTGSISNATWHIFLIQRSDTGVVDILASLSPTAPTMPTSYDRKRRIGSIIRASNTIVSFLQYGDTFLRSVPVNDETATNPGTSAITVTLSVPTGIVVGALVSAMLSDATSGGATFLLATSLTQADTTPSNLLFDLATEGAGGSPSRTAGDLLPKWTNTSAQMRYRVNRSNGDIVTKLTTMGWVDTRGRDV